MYRQSTPFTRYLLHIAVAVILIPFILLIMGYLAWIIGIEPLFRLDVRLQSLIFPISGDTLYRLLPAALLITTLGSFWITLLAALASALWFWIRRRNKFIAVSILVSFAAMWLLNLAVKALLQRDRPSLQHLTEAAGYSFPSGHAMIAMGFYGLLFAIWTIHNRIRGRSVVFPLLTGALLILLIGLSRIYLGVHYPSDVAGGYIAGALWLCFTLPPMYAWIKNSRDPGK
ncbi:phosphatase PAP2 family protein [Paenibacillus sp. P96]|uniref:Phosphatase PAP2 family protein n=1 Tax=Paenibacillus zeirhizosphaerae TaxID=2987519 RepID=A0ABT9FUA7_9BACL|nr:phosphatase PAP2 family protein [Paenibacillus sp. P96]MDP4098081.1 phosphatase PAP2 family protein [Paenibacillus sp. P96]